MAQAMDAATVLEEFVHDVANLPAEIAHLLEEVQAKDQVVQECRIFINKQDRILQKHVKEHGGQVKHPKEDQMHKAVLAKYDEAETLQQQKIVLSNKAAFLLDRHVKRLDIKIRDLQNEGSMLPDPQLPSLLRHSLGNLVDPVSGTGSGVSTPNPATMSNGNSNNIANTAVARMIASNTSVNNRSVSAAPMTQMQTQLPQRQRESSLGATSESKRRRLTANLNLGSIPAQSSNLARQSSLGPPGTPKVGTPGSRAGSAGPRTKKPTKKLAPHQQHPGRKKLTKNEFPIKPRRRLMGIHKGSPSTTGDDDSQAGSGSDDERGSNVRRPGEEEDVEEGGYEEDGEDTTLYCVCNTVSRGNMVACDNEKCSYEWFHWDCVGLTEEPEGKWLCPHCEKLPKSQLKVAKG